MAGSLVLFLLGTILLLPGLCGLMAAFSLITQLDLTLLPVVIISLLIGAVGLALIKGAIDRH